MQGNGKVERTELTKRECLVKDSEGLSIMVITLAGAKHQATDKYRGTEGLFFLEQLNPGLFSFLSMVNLFLEALIQGIVDKGKSFSLHYILTLNSLK